MWEILRANKFVLPEGSTVPRDQMKMLRETEKVLLSIAKDVRGGLLETVGIESAYSTDGGRTSMMLLKLPDGSDPLIIAEAIDAENVEAWTDENHQVHIAINPWYSTKDVDQTVLSTIKIIHVLLGIHAADEVKPKTFKEKLLSSVMEIMETRK